MSLNLITIDFWNTLFDSGGGIQRNEFRLEALKKEISGLGISINENDFIRAMQSSWDYFNLAWKNEFRTPSTAETVEFFWNFLRLPYKSESLERLTTAFTDSVLHFPPTLIGGVRESLALLKNNYKLAIVSDTGFSPGIVLRQLLKKNSIFDLFDSFSFSDETGVSKPHPKAFLKAIEELDVSPETSLHIGDIEETDITGASSLGMKTISFDGDKENFTLPDVNIETKADFTAKSWDEVCRIISSVFVPEEGIEPPTHGL